MIPALGLANTATKEDKGKINERNPHLLEKVAHDPIDKIPEATNADAESETVRKEGCPAPKEIFPFEAPRRPVNPHNADPKATDLASDLHCPIGIPNNW